MIIMILCAAHLGPREGKCWKVFVNKWKKIDKKKRKGKSLFKCFSSLFLSPSFLNPSPFDGLALFSFLNDILAFLFLCLFFRISLSFEPLCSSFLFCFVFFSFLSFWHFPLIIYLIFLWIPLSPFPHFLSDFLPWPIISEFSLPFFPFPFHIGLCCISVIVLFSSYPPPPSFSLSINSWL